MEGEIIVAAVKENDSLTSFDARSGDMIAGVPV